MLDQIKRLIVSYQTNNIELAMIIGLNNPTISISELISVIRDTIQDNKDICVTKVKNPKGETIIRGNNHRINGVYWSGLSFYYAEEGNTCLQETIAKTLLTLPRC